MTSINMLKVGEYVEWREGKIIGSQHKYNWSGVIESFGPTIIKRVHGPHAGKSWTHDGAVGSLVRIPDPRQDVTFSDKAVIDAVFAYSGCDQGKYEWLAKLGLSKVVVDSIRCAMKRFDIVESRRDEIGLTIRRLYTALNVTNGSVQVIDDAGDEHWFHCDKFKIHTAAATQRTVTAEPQRLCKQAVIELVRQDDTRTPEQQTEWLRSVGLTNDEIDEFSIPRLGCYDIVRALTSVALVKGRLYMVKDRVDVNMVSLYGIGGRFNSKAFELVQKA